MVWALFDCDRKEHDEAVFAGIDDEEWDDENVRLYGGRTILTYAAKLGESKPDLSSPFAFRMGQYLTNFLHES